MKFPLSIILLFLAPCLFFLTSRLIASNSENCGYSVHPQQGKTGDLFDIIAGDTRTIISVALLEKADAYYHGGQVDHGDCPVTAADEKDDHDHDAHHEEEHTSNQSQAWRDPWRYLNSRLQTSAHIHLDLASAEELLPWYWAACEASPHNIQALEATAFVLAYKMGKTQEALQLLEKGIRDNPYSVILEISRGEILLKHVNDFKNAEKAFLGAYQKSLHEKAPKDDLLKAKALFYLGHIAKNRKDLQALQQWQTIARETMSLELLSICNLLELK